MINVKIKSQDDTKPKELNYPRLVKNGGDQVVLLTGKSKQGFSKGFMVSDNGFYRPFAYYSEEWDDDHSLPFNGEITISNKV